jgi:hypothetical protein
MLLFLVHTKHLQLFPDILFFFFDAHATLHCPSRCSAARSTIKYVQLSRYQYLELAYYLVNGRCQDVEDPGDDGFILNLYTYRNIADYHKRSPNALTRDTEDVYSKEFLFGSRVSMKQGYTKEDRTFMYTDKKVRVNFQQSCGARLL